MRRVTQFVLFAAILMSGLFSSQAQAQKIPPFLGVSNGNQVVLILTSTPQRNWSFDVYRKAPGGAFQKITAHPVQQAQTPAQLQKILGNSFDQIADYLNADNAFQVFRRLHSSAFKAGLLSLIDQKVAQGLGRMYVDSNAVGNGALIYKIVFLDEKGQTKRIFTQTVNKQVFLPLSPTHVKAEVSDRTVTLYWNYPLWNGNVRDLAFQFYVYRKSATEAKFKKINSHILFRERKSDFSFTDTWLKNGRRYQYYIVAVDLLGREGTPSRTIQVIPKDNVPPEIPKGLVLEEDSNRVRLSWSMSPELDVRGYAVYRAPTLRSTFQKISTLLPADAPFFVDKTVQSNKIYFYRVAAVDSSGNWSKRSNPISILVGDHEPPVAPSQIKVAVQKGKMVVTWLRSPSQDVAGYKIYFGEIKNHLPLITPQKLPANASRFEDDGRHLVPGRTQYLAVTAVDSARNESPQLPVVVKIPDWQAPASPAFLNVRVRRDGLVEIKWAGSLSPDVHQYVLSRFLHEKNEQVLGKFPATILAWNDSTAQIGATYTYAIVAIDSSGNKSDMRVKKVTIRDGIPPTAPRDITARLTPKGVQVRWGRVVEPDLAGFNVYRSTLPTGVFKKINTELLTQREFLDTTGKKIHWYKVRAVDTSGNESPWKSAVGVR